MRLKRMNPVSAPPLEGVASPRGRIASLDQFRGYTVAGILLVNFLGGFAVVPAYPPVPPAHVLPSGRIAPRRSTPTAPSPIPAAPWRLPV
jgi:hypothetical protein